MPQSKDFGPVFWIHLTAVLIIFISPFLFSWKAVFVGMVAYYLQIKIRRGCILTQWEFRGQGHDDTFYYHYLKKIKPDISRAGINFIADRVVPPALLFLALIYQVFFEIEPLF